MKNERIQWESGPKLEFDLREIVSGLFRYRKAAWITFGVTALAGTLSVFLVGRRLYTAEMQVLVEQDRADPAVTSGPSAPAMLRSVSTDQVASELELLKGKDMLLTIVDRCKLVDDAPSWHDLFHSKDPSVRHAIKREIVASTMAKKIVAAAGVTSDVITVKYSVVGAPEVPACVLSNLSTLYVAKHMRLQRPVGSFDFFVSQAENYRLALERSEADLRALSSSEGIAAPDVLRTDFANQLAAAEAGLNEATQSIAAGTERARNLKQQIGSTPARSPTTQISTSANALMQQLEESLLTAQNRRSQLALKFSDSYPSVKEADEEISQTQKAIARAGTMLYVNNTTDRDPTYEFLREEAARTEANLVSQRASQRALRASISSLEQQMVHLDDLSIRQTALQRELHANESNYLLYVNKREQERTSDALDKSGVANVAIAVAPMVPVNPAYGTTRMLMGVLLVASFLGIVAAYLCQALDSSFRTPQELRRMLGIDVLAALPKTADSRSAAEVWNRHTSRAAVLSPQR